MILQESSFFRRLDIVSSKKSNRSLYDDLVEVSKIVEAGTMLLTKKDVNAT